MECPALKKNDAKDISCYILMNQCLKKDLGKIVVEATEEGVTVKKRMTKISKKIDDRQFMG